MTGSNLKCCQYSLGFHSYGSLGEKNIHNKTQFKPLYLCWNPTEIKSTLAAAAQGGRWLKASQVCLLLFLHSCLPQVSGSVLWKLYPLQLQTGKINSKWWVQPLGWGQWWRGEDSWGTARHQGRKAMRTQRAVACTGKTCKCKALHRYPKWSHTLCKDTGRPPACSRATWTQTSKTMTFLSSKVTRENLMGNKAVVLLNS